MDNVLLCHELVRGHERKGIPPRMLIKADLKMAWCFSRSLLEQMSLPQIFVKWIMMC